MEQEGLGFCVLNLLTVYSCYLHYTLPYYFFSCATKHCSISYFYHISKARGRKFSNSILFGLVDLSPATIHSFSYTRDYSLNIQFIIFFGCSLDRDVIVH